MRFPRVYRDVSGKRVLVAEFFDGHHLDRATGELCFSGERIAKIAVNVVAKMIFVDGLFHADPHPGNIRILGTPEAPVVGLLDLGLVGRLTPGLRDKATDLMMAAVKKDVDELADALLAMGRARGKVDRDAFRAEVARLAEIFTWASRSGRFSWRATIARPGAGARVKFEIEMPVEMMMVGKSLMTIESTGKAIYPDLDVFEEAKPFFAKLLWARYSPAKIGQRLLKTASRLSDVAGAATDVPPMIAEVLDDVRRGRLKDSEPRTPSTARATERLGRRIALGLVSASLVASGCALWLHGATSIGGWLWGAAALTSVMAWGRLAAEK